MIGWIIRSKWPTGKLDFHSLELYPTKREAKENESDWEKAVKVEVTVRLWSKKKGRKE